MFNSKNPLSLACISVLFDSIEMPAKFSSPVVMAAHVEYLAPIGANWKYYWSRICEAANAPVDGTYFEVPPSLLSKEHDIRRVEISVVALDTITSSELLESLVIVPLLDRISHHSRNSDN